MSTFGKLRVRLQVEVITNRANEMVWASTKVGFRAASLERGFHLGQEEEDCDVDEGPGYQNFFPKQGDTSKSFSNNCL